MNRRILLVDDDEALLARLARHLGEDHEVTTAGSAEEALELLEERGPFAAVVTDQGLPGLSGVALLARAAEAFPSTVRLMMTGCAQVYLALEALEEGGIFRFLVKPVPDAFLDEVLRQALRRHEREEEERVRVEELAFSREGLVGMTATLESRVRLQEERLAGLGTLVTALRAAPTPGQVLDLAADGLDALLDGRPLRLTRWGTESAAHDTSRRGRLGETVLRLPLWIVGHERGEILVDVARPLNAGLRTTLDIAAAAVTAALEGLEARRHRMAQRLGTVRGLAQVAEHRDEITGRHLERVGLYCRTLAEVFPDVGPDFVEDLVVASALHDVGKVAVPDAILGKAGPLSEEEWVVMRGHTLRGAETLALVLEVVGEDPLLRMAHDVALSHHERWDGGGYPHGLAGEDIPLAARIVSLADVYDALTTARPYKRAWSHAEALEEISHLAGAQFDPRLVEALQRQADTFDRIRAELADVPGDEAA